MIKSPKKSKLSEDEDLVAKLKNTISELEDENFRFYEQIEWLSFQLKNSSLKKDSSLSFTPNETQELLAPNEERRFKTLSDALLYWKERALKLEKEFQGRFNEVRKTNEDLKNLMLSQNESFKEEIYSIVKKVKVFYQKVSYRNNIILNEDRKICKY